MPLSKGLKLHFFESHMQVVEINKVMCCCKDFIIKSMGLFLLWFHVIYGGDVVAADWLAFRGNSGNSYSSDVPSNWQAPKLKWKVDLSGESYGGIAVKSKYVIVTDHTSDGAKDIFHCVDAETGKHLWKIEIENGKEMDFGASPRAHPLIYEDLVFLVNAHGKVIAAHLKDGKEAWKTDLVEDYGGEAPEWGYCTSPIIAGGNLILMPGGSEGLIALNPKTGEDVWSAKCKLPNYAGLLVAKFSGKEQIIGYDEETLRGWLVKDGKELWKLDISSPNGYIVPAPTQVGDKMLLVDDVKGARLYGFSEEGKVVDKILAEGEDYACELASPLVVGNLAFFSAWGLICADATTLKQLWIEEDNESLSAEMLTFMTNGKQLLAFAQSGELTLLPVTKEKPKILGQVKLCEETQALPALSGKNFYVRDKKHLYCYQITGS